MLLLPDLISFPILSNVGPSLAIYSWAFLFLAFVRKDFMFLLLNVLFASVATVSNPLPKFGAIEPSPAGKSNGAFAASLSLSLKGAQAKGGCSTTLTMRHL